MPSTKYNIIDLDEYRRRRWPHLWAEFERARDKSRADPTGAHDIEAAEALRRFRQGRTEGRECLA